MPHTASGEEGEVTCLEENEVRLKAEGRKEELEVVGGRRRNIR